MLALGSGAICVAEVAAGELLFSDKGEDVVRIRSPDVSTAFFFVSCGRGRTPPMSAFPLKGANRRGWGGRRRSLKKGQWGSVPICAHGAIACLRVRHFAGAAFCYPYHK